MVHLVARRQLKRVRGAGIQAGFEKVRAVSDTITMDIRWEGKRRAARSYLSELLDIVNGTGRRITAVCSLRYEDLQLDEARFGAIRWPADTDKMGRETRVPISPQVRAALDRVLLERPGIGAAYLFPSPVDRNKPIRYELASAWLLKAEFIRQGSDLLLVGSSPEADMKSLLSNFALIN